jgi:RND family efflux transporter MFP subunit
MREKWSSIPAILLVLAILAGGCSSKSVTEQQMAIVTRGDLLLLVSSDGNLDMPNQVQLKFGTPGTVRDIPAEKYKLEGRPVRAGTLLAKLDDITQLLTVEAAQYALELAINNVVQTSCSTRYPTFYTLATAIMRFEQARGEVLDARSHLLNKNYYEAASDLSLAKYDLDATRSVYADPKLDTIQTQYSDPTKLDIIQAQYNDTSDPILGQLVSIMDAQIGNLGQVQSLIESGNYPSALTAIDDLIVRLDGARTIVDANSRLPGAYIYPDISTSLSISRQVLDAISDIETMIYQDNFDRVKTSEKLRMAQHDLLMSNRILDERETIYRDGLNPQELRKYNINIETALINLNQAKQELLKTEIIAPFDGTIVAVDVKVNDQLSQFDYSSKTAVHLVDTKTIRMTGIIDEIDITKVKVGQQAILTVDALPGQMLNGHVTFVSPFGALQSGVVTFPVEVYLDPSENATDLRGGLTATADIVIRKKENVLQVPNRAVKGLSGDYWVDIVIDPATAVTEKRLVQIGIQNKKNTEIISGLKEGEKVLIEAIK